MQGLETALKHFLDVIHCGGCSHRLACLISVLRIVWSLQTAPGTAQTLMSASPAQEHQRAFPEAGSYQTESHGQGWRPEVCACLRSTGGLQL